MKGDRKTFGERKEQKYQRLYNQLASLLGLPGTPLSRMATINAVLYHKMDYFFWAGFYLLDGEALSAGPYQGPVACQVLTPHRGVCWSAIDQKQTIVVPDVHKFPGHIACDSRSQSEIAVPLYNGDVITGVFDVDSKELNAFDETDAVWLEKIIGLLNR